MYYLFPNSLSIDFFCNFGIFSFNRILLNKRLSGNSSFHKIIADFYRDICPCYLTFCHLCIDKSLRIRVLNRNTQHQSSTTSVLSDFTGRVGITFHKRNQPGRSQRRILNRRTFRANMRKIMAYTTTALH